VAEGEEARLGNKLAQPGKIEREGGKPLWGEVQEDGRKKFFDQEKKNTSPGGGTLYLGSNALTGTRLHGVFPY